jgi:hypothetical protein
MPLGTSPNHGTDTIEPAAPTPRRPAVVRAWLAATILVFVATIGLLFWQWAAHREPSSVIIVEGTPRFDGVDVRVSGGTLPAPYEATLSAANEFRVPFFLDAGVYVVWVARGGQALSELEVILTRRVGQRIDLRPLEPRLDDAPPATRRSTDPTPEAVKP